MTTLVQLLASACWLGGVVCFILLLVEMFRRGQVGLAAVFILLTCCGVGVFVAFIYGWLRVREWSLQNLMTWWTTFFVVGLLGSALGGVFQFIFRPLHWPF